MQLDATWPGPDGLVRIEVASGEKIRLAGPNGSGKTTILRRWAGLPTHVHFPATLDGQDPGDAAAPWLAQHLDFVPADARDRLVGLTSRGEARLRGRTMPGVPDRDVATLSTGEATRLALGLCGAPVWLLDEPGDVLDGAGRAELARRIRDHDGTVVFTDHHGALGDAATRTIELAPTATATFDVPAPHGPPRLHSGELAFPSGATVVQGPNGCGKTTLLRTLAGLRGEATLDDSPVRPGMVPMLGPDAWQHLAHDTVAQALPAGGLGLVPDALLDRHPWTLSRGEAQRVALAQVLGRDAPAYLLDEPEAHLDAAGLATLSGLLERRREACLVIASHDRRLDGVDL